MNIYDTVKTPFIICFKQNILIWLVMWFCSELQILENIVNVMSKILGVDSILGAILPV